MKLAREYCLWTRTIWLWAINCSCRESGFPLGSKILWKWRSFRLKKPTLESKEPSKSSKWGLACRRKRKSSRKSSKERKSTPQINILLRISRRYWKNLDLNDIFLNSSFQKLTSSGFYHRVWVFLNIVLPMLEQTQLFWVAQLLKMKSFLDIFLLFFSEFLLKLCLDLSFCWLSSLYFFIQDDSFNVKNNQK